MILLLLLFSTVYGWPQITRRDWVFYEKKNCSTNCIYEYVVLNYERISQFPTICPTVCGYIDIKEPDELLTEELLTATFKDMKHLVGGIQISSTNFTSLKFLAGLESLESNTYGINLSKNKKLVELDLTNLTSMTGPGLTVSECPKLQKLNIPKLNNFIFPQTGTYTIQLVLRTESLKFCLTTQEISNWIRANNTDIWNVEGKFCEPVFTEKLCKKPKKGCVEMFGDVEIKDNMESMNSVEIIYGSLIIYGSNLTDFGIFEQLEYVVQLGKKAAISVTENSQLVNYTFPKLKRTHSGTGIHLLFQNNKKLTETFRNASICSEIQKSLGLNDYGLIIDGGFCDNIRYRELRRVSRGRGECWMHLTFLITLIIS